MWTGGSAGSDDKKPLTCGVGFGVGYKGKPTQMPEQDAIDTAQYLVPKTNRFGLEVSDGLRSEYAVMQFAQLGLRTVIPLTSVCKAVEGLSLESISR